MKGMVTSIEDPLTLQDYDHFNLEVGYEDGSDRVLLWLPVICKHVINDDSPLASWLKPSGIMADADSSIVVVVSVPMLLPSDCVFVGADLQEGIYGVSCWHRQRALVHVSRAPNPRGRCNVVILGSHPRLAERLLLLCLARALIECAAEA